MKNIFIIAHIVLWTILLNIIFTYSASYINDNDNKIIINIKKELMDGDLISSSVVIGGISLLASYFTLKSIN